MIDKWLPEIEFFKHFENIMKLRTILQNKLAM
jgi:hypothetical protein